MRDIFWLSSHKAMNETLAYDEALQAKGVFDSDGNYDIKYGNYDIKYGNSAIITHFGTLYNRPSHTQKYTGGRDCRALIDIRKKYTFDKEVENIICLYDSGGGESSGILETTSFYHSCEVLKPSVALISGFCCSGALVLATTSTRVLLSSPGDVVGGATAISWRDKRSDNFDVLSAGELKNPQQRERSPIRDEYMKEILNHLSKMCLSSIKLERKLTIEQIQSLAAGRIFFGEDAVRVGLCDGFFSPFAWHISREIVEIPIGSDEG